MSYSHTGREGKGREKQEKAGKDVGSDCHIFNENGTVSGYQTIQFWAGSNAIIPQNKSSEKLTFYTLNIAFLSLAEFTHRRDITYVTEFDRNMQLEPGIYDIYIAERRTTRLPYPYTSNCTDGKLVQSYSI